MGQLGFVTDSVFNDDCDVNAVVPRVVGALLLSTSVFSVVSTFRKYKKDYVTLH